MPSASFAPVNSTALYVVPNTYTIDRALELHCRISRTGTPMPKQRREFLAALTAAAGVVLLPNSASAAQQPTPTTTTRETVTGIGGFFYRAHDPKALEQWYHDHLGILLTPQTLTDPVWQQQAGQTLVSAFPETSKYFGPDLSKQWMINFRVSNLARMVAQLQAAGVAVKVDDNTYPNGRFAHLHDPEGNPIELWQPAATSATR